jgi:hypothetical protein
MYFYYYDHKLQRYPRDGLSYSDIYDQEVLDSLSDRPIEKYKEDSKQHYSNHTEKILHMITRILCIVTI